MGMFDRLHDFDIRCPRCDSHFGHEIQTKDLNCLCETYYVWQPEYDEEPPRLVKETEFARADGQERYIEATFICKSASCMATERMQDYVRMGYISGFSLSWLIRYKVREDGLVVGPAEFIEEEFSDCGEIYAAFLRKIAEESEKDEDVKKYWDKAMKLSFDNPALAVLYFHPPHKRRVINVAEGV